MLNLPDLKHTCIKNSGHFRVANSHAYGVILTHLTCYSRTHAIDKFTHAFLKNHTHTHAILKNQNNLLFLIIVRLITALKLSPTFIYSETD